jgi:hypothetical protein
MKKLIALFLLFSTFSFSMAAMAALYGKYCAVPDLYNPATVYVDGQWVPAGGSNYQIKSLDGSVQVHVVGKGGKDYTETVTNNQTLVIHLEHADIVNPGQPGSLSLCNINSSTPSR